MSQPPNHAVKNPGPLLDSQQLSRLGAQWRTFLAAHRSVAIPASVPAAPNLVEQAPLPARPAFGSILLLFFLCGSIVVYLLYVTEPQHNGKALHEWLQELQSPDPRAQAAAEEAVRQFGKAAVPTIVDWLRSRDTWLKLKCVELENRQSFFEFPFGLAMEKRALAFEACRVLGSEAEGALPALVELADLDPGAVPVMAALGPGALHSLIAALSHPNRSVRLNAAEALARYRTGELKVISALLKCLSRPESEMKFFAIKSLGTIRPDPGTALPVLMERLFDTSPSVRRIAADVIGKYGLAGQPAVPVLLNKLKDPHPNVRRSAALSLYQIDPGSVLPALKEVFLSESGGEWAARVLVQIGPAGTAIFYGGLTNHNPVIRSRTFSWLTTLRLEARTLTPFLIAGVRDPDGEVRKNAARALASVGSVQDMAILVELLENSDPEIKFWGLHALRRVGFERREISPFVSRLLEDPNPLIRATSASFLQAMEVSGPMAH